MAPPPPSMTTMTKEEMAVDEGLGYPKAFAKLCRNVQDLNSYSLGPPLDYIPSPLPSHQVSKEKHLNNMFPVVVYAEEPSVDPNGFLNLLWKQLSHLGNAGFDPGLFRVDPYGNVLYFHADQASPLFWRIDHWFPIARGGRTVPSNLRVLQWQVSMKKKNKMEFLIPWWDLQLGISVNQFLSIFASRNSDFKHRGFSFLFKEGGSEELNGMHVVESHRFPRHSSDLRHQVGLSPASVTVLRGDKLHNHHHHRRCRSGSISKENCNPNLAAGGEGEGEELEKEMGALKERNDRERVAVRELEGVLLKKRKRVEKCRRLAEAQASYKALLEKMIRDAMHQSVVYKENLRQNQAAAGALKARLETQREICDRSEKELHRRYKQRDELEKQIGGVSSSSSSRKRSRSSDAGDDATLPPPLPPSSRKKKELREFLEEEQWAAEAAAMAVAEEEEEEEGWLTRAGAAAAAKTELDMRCEANHENTTSAREDGDEIGKGNLEKWVQILLDNAKDGCDGDGRSSSPMSAAPGSHAKAVKWNKNEWKRGRREIGRVGGRYRSVSPSPSVASRRSDGGLCRSVMSFRD